MKKPTKVKLRDYQERGKELIKSSPIAALFVRMGLGKTLTVLRAVHELMWDSLTVKRVLIVAPKKVALIAWPKEIAKWTPNLSYQVVFDDKAKDIRKDVAIHIISYSTLPWLYKEILTNPAGLPRFDMVVLDESTYIKNPSSKRWQLCCAMFRAIPKKVIMSGRPSPNSLQDYWAQVFFLDEGARLFKTYGGFRSNYFMRINGAGESEKFVPMRGAKDEIAERVSDIALTVTNSDQLKLPKLIENDVICTMDKKMLKAYRQMESESLFDAPGEVIQIKSAASMTMKLRQFIQGFVYDENHNAHELNEVKLDALVDLVDQNEGVPIIVAIQFLHEVEMIRRRFPGVPAINSKTKDKEAAYYLDQYNEGKLPMLLVHPASVSHGLNIQEGGNTVAFYANTWNLDEYEQLIARLHRGGQQSATVTVHRFFMANTVDEIMLDVLSGKARTQNSVLAKLVEYRENRGKK